jgi:hypothetical protein
VLWVECCICLGTTSRHPHACHCTDHKSPVIPLARATLIHLTMLSGRSPSSSSDPEMWTPRFPLHLESKPLLRSRTTRTTTTGSILRLASLVTVTAAALASHEHDVNLFGRDACPCWNMDALLDDFYGSQTPAKDDPIALPPTLCGTVEQLFAADLHGSSHQIDMQQQQPRSFFAKGKRLVARDTDIPTWMFGVDANLNAESSYRQIMTHTSSGRTGTTRTVGGCAGSKCQVSPAADPVVSTAASSAGNATVCAYKRGDDSVTQSETTTLQNYACVVQLYTACQATSINDVSRDFPDDLRVYRVPPHGARGTSSSSDKQQGASMGAGSPFPSDPQVFLRLMGIRQLFMGLQSHFG